jgi:hypothetical protein
LGQKFKTTRFKDFKKSSHPEIFKQLLKFQITILSQFSADKNMCRSKVGCRKNLKLQQMRIQEQLTIYLSANNCKQLKVKSDIQGISKAAFNY